MKQLWLIAALIALMAGTAQAVTVGWDRGWMNLTGGAPGVGARYAGSMDGNSGAWGTVWAGTNANYATLVTTGPTLGQGIILGTGANGKGANNQFRLGINAAGQWEVSLSG